MNHGRAVVIDCSNNFVTISNCIIEGRVAVSVLGKLPGYVKQYIRGSEYLIPKLCVERRIGIGDSRFFICQTRALCFDCQ